MFMEHFRLNKRVFQRLRNDLRLHTSLRGSYEIPLEIKVLTALSFFPTGSYQRIVGIISHCLTQRTTSRCIRQVVDALNCPTIMAKWIQFPQTVQESGANHDAHIWSTSVVEPYMRQHHDSGGHVWLLGDSGYPQRPWLMTPILNAPQRSREATYTTRHVQGRTCIERCFGLLKTRWRCLLRDRVLH